MKTTTVIFGPGVDGAIVSLIDYVDLESIPAVIVFLEHVQQRLVKTLSTFPESGSPYQGRVRTLSVEGYTFLYEYHEAAHEVHVLEMIAPGRNWR